MANKLYEESSVRAIADKIREKAATESAYTVSEMAGGVDAVYSKGYMDGQTAGGGGITPTGEINITENGTYDVTRYASALVSVASSGGSSVHCGTFTIGNKADGEREQVSVETTYEVDIGVISDVRSISLFYAGGNSSAAFNNGVLYGWYGSRAANSYFRTSNEGFEAVSVLDAAAQYLRYDQSTGKLYAKAGQWFQVMCGTYFWIVVTGGDL